MTGSSGFPFSCWGVFMCDYSYFKIQNKQTLMSKRVGRPLVFKQPLVFGFNRSTTFRVWHAHTDAHLPHSLLYLLGAPELHEVALTLVIIVSQSKNVSLWAQETIKFSTESKKGGGRGQMEREKGVTKCVPNEKRRQDEKKCSFPGGTSLTFKGPFCSSCTSVLFQSNSSSLTNKQQSAVFHMAKAFLADLKWIDPGGWKKIC